MPIDYAISPVGQDSENERLLDSGPSEAIRHFDGITDSGPNPSLSIDGSGSPIKITQEASSLNGSPLKTMSSWSSVSSHLTSGLETLRRFFRTLMKGHAASGKSTVTGSGGSIDRTTKVFEHLTKLAWRLSLGQIGMAIVTSISGLFHKTLNTLFRQQG